VLLRTKIVAARFSSVMVTSEHEVKRKISPAAAGRDSKYVAGRGIESPMSPKVSNSSNVSAQPEQEEEPYPEGGLRAWLSVLGSLCGMMCCFGLMNTIGTFQAYISRNQLASYSQADIGWIFGLYLFIAYFSGIVTGSLFDAQGPRFLMAMGAVCLVACMFLLSACKSQYRSWILLQTPSPSTSMYLAADIALKNITTSFLSSQSLVALELPWYLLPPLPRLDTFLTSAVDLLRG